VHALLVALAMVTALGAAVRSTWSPCGLSMLSSITPLGERGRGNRYGVTVAWFVAGAMLGGATLGLLTAALAAAVAAGHLPVGVVTGFVAAASLATAASDSGVLGFHLPYHRRQVNERWLDQYRSWVYGAGYGWQIGTGLATYVMTSAVYLTIVLGAATGSPRAAAAVGVLFGTVRGVAVLLGARLTTPEALAGFHRRFDALGRPVRAAVVALQVAVAEVAAAGVWRPGALVVAGVAGAGGSLTLLRARRRTVQPTPMGARVPASASAGPGRPR